MPIQKRKFDSSFNNNSTTSGRDSRFGSDSPIESLVDASRPTFFPLPLPPAALEGVDEKDLRVIISPEKRQFCTIRITPSLKWRQKWLFVVPPIPAPWKATLESLADVYVLSCNL